MQGQERYHGLDFVRAVAMMLGVVLHVSMFFCDNNSFHWIAGEHKRDSLNTFAVRSIHFFRMQLFMLLAGFFAELVLQKKGMDALMRDRLKRILWPFLIGILFFMPFFMYMTDDTWPGAFTNIFDDTSALDQIKSYILWGAFTDKPTFKEINFWHFWFIYFLLFFYLFHWLFYQLGHKDILFKNNTLLNKLIYLSIANKWGFLILTALAFPIHYSLQSPMFWPSHFNFQVNELIYYFGFYVFGVYLYKNIYLIKTLAHNGWFYIIISLPFVCLLNAPTERYDLMRNVVVDITTWKIANIQLWEEGLYSNANYKALIVFLRCAVSWTLCLGFIGLAHRYLNKPGRYVRYLADSAYWVFWVHVLFTIYFSRYAQQMSFGNSLFKAVIIFYLSMFLMYFMYNNYIRYTFLGDYFMGSRKDPNHPDEVHFNTVNITKKTAPIFFVSLCVAFFCGYLDDSIKNDTKREASAEALGPRDKTILEDFESLSGVNDTYGRNPMHIASLFPEPYRIYNPIPILLKKSVDINEQDFVGRTPLFYAVRTGNLKDAEFLIENGAEMSLADDYGHTPAHVAAIKTGSYDPKASDQYLDILKLLKDQGANLNAKDYKGRTVHDCLKYFGNRKLN
ncbi:MAG: acyltransferase family protein [Nitrospinaceae bacterium]|nr:acyltransferase family protein [Nitrospinaceae bacterium]